MFTSTMSSNLYIYVWHLDNLRGCHLVGGWTVNNGKERMLYHNHGHCNV